MFISYIALTNNLRADGPYRSPEIITFFIDEEVG